MPLFPAPVNIPNVASLLLEMKRLCYPLYSTVFWMFEIAISMAAKDTEYIVFQRQKVHCYCSLVLLPWKMNDTTHKINRYVEAYISIIIIML